MAKNKRLTGLADYAAAALLGLAMVPFSASAFTIYDTTTDGSTFLATWELQAGVTDPNGNTNLTGVDLTGSALFTFLGSSGNTIDLEITLTNTTVANSVTAGLQKFGFATDPYATVADFIQDGDTAAFAAIAGDTDKVISADNSVSPEVQNSTPQVIDVEARTDTGAPKALLSGEFDVFRLTLSYATLDLAAGVEFSPFAVKYQTNRGSYEFPGDDCPPGTPGCGAPPTGVPVPGTLVLLGLGALLGRKQLLKKAA